MKESITSRVTRIVSGGLNAIVDAVESAMPDTVMEEAIREIDAAIDEARAELGKIAARKHLANNRLMEENRRHESLAEKIEIALAEGREDLAETAVGQQLDIEAQIPVLENAIADAAKQEKEFDGYVQALQAKKREMQNELRLFRETQRNIAERADTSANNANSLDVKASKASETFARVMEKASGLGANTRNLNSKQAAELAELETLARNNRVRERLAALKKHQSSDK